MSYTDALSCWELYQKGMAGPSAQYITAYNNYVMLHNLTQVLIAVNSKNYYQKKPEQFRDIFSEQFKIFTLQQDKPELSMATKAAMSLIDDNAPQWLKEAVMEEVGNGSTRSSSDH